MLVETWRESCAGLVSLAKVEGGRHEKEKTVRRTMCVRVCVCEQARMVYFSIIML